MKKAENEIRRTKSRLGKKVEVLTPKYPRNDVVLYVKNKLTRSGKPKLVIVRKETLSPYET